MDNFNNDMEMNNTVKTKSSFPVPKIIFVVLGIILLLEIIYAAKVLTQPAAIPPSPTPPPSTGNNRAVQTPGKISLITSKTNYKVREAIPVSVVIDTGSNEISGVDLIVQFDPKILEATSGGLVKGKILDEYPLVTADAKKGLITISGINSLESGFTGKGEFALINFRAKSPGKASLIINLDKGSTTASNLVESATARNILDTVDNVDLYVQ